MYAGIDSLLMDHCLIPHSNYKEMTKLVRIMVCGLSVKRATPPSGMWKLKLAPLLIESNQPLQLNYLLTKKSCSSSHVEGGKESVSGISDIVVFHCGVRKVFSAKLNV